MPVAAEQEALAAMRELQAEGLTHAVIAAALRDAGHPTKRGRAWSQPVASRILRRDTDLTPDQRRYQAERLSSVR